MNYYLKFNHLSNIVIPSEVLGIECWVRCFDVWVVPYDWSLLIKPVKSFYFLDYYFFFIRHLETSK